MCEREREREREGERDRLSCLNKGTHPINLHLTGTSLEPSQSPLTCILLQCLSGNMTRSSTPIMTHTRTHSTPVCLQGLPAHSDGQADTGTFSQSNSAALSPVPFGRPTPPAIRLPCLSSQCPPSPGTSHCPHPHGPELLRCGQPQAVAPFVYT